LLLLQTEEDYNALIEALDTVLDAGGADENHPLAALADRMGELVAQYEEAHG
jgi:HTH-type transcriptional regulator/antitoxin HigA